MLIMQKWDIFSTWNILQMLFNRFYYHNMRYKTDPMTQIEEKYLKSRKVILDIFCLIMQKWDHFRRGRGSGDKSRFSSFSHFIIWVIEVQELFTEMKN